MIITPQKKWPLQTILPFDACQIGLGSCHSVRRFSTSSPFFLSGSNETKIRLQECPVGKVWVKHEMGRLACGGSCRLQLSPIQ